MAQDGRGSPFRWRRWAAPLAILLALVGILYARYHRPRLAYGQRALGGREMQGYTLMHMVPWAGKTGIDRVFSRELHWGQDVKWLEVRYRAVGDEYPRLTPLGADDPGFGRVYLVDRGP
jgi:hypothetical protein